MAFTTMEQVLAALPGQRLGFAKAFPATFAGFASWWLGTGRPAAGSAPSSGLAGDVPTSATAGALTFVNAASGGLSLARCQAVQSVNNGAIHLVLYDRLWHNSGISATAVTSQTINSVALTRPDANGSKVEAWWEVYAPMGAGTPNVTLTYTDQNGNTGNTATSGVLATTLAAGRTGPFLMAAGDTGVRSIQTWQADATFSSGTIGLVMRRRIADIPIIGQSHEIHDALRSVLSSIPSNACLDVVALATNGTNYTVMGELSLIEG